MGKLESELWWLGTTFEIKRHTPIVGYVVHTCYRGQTTSGIS